MELTFKKHPVCAVQLCWAITWVFSNRNEAKSYIKMTLGTKE